MRDFDEKLCEMMAQTDAMTAIMGGGDYAHYYASMLFNSGCRLIPDGSVVLTREEVLTQERLKEDFDELINQRVKDDDIRAIFIRPAMYKSFIEVEKEQARKETARDILKAIKNFLDEDDYNNYYFEILAIAKECGVEVEE